MYNNKSLVLYQFNNIIAVGFPLGPMTCLAIGSLPSDGANYGFHPVELDLKPISG